DAFGVVDRNEAADAIEVDTVKLAENAGRKAAVRYGAADIEEAGVLYLVVQRRRRHSCEIGAGIVDGDVAVDLDGLDTVAALAVDQAASISIGRLVVDGEVAAPQIIDIDAVIAAEDQAAIGHVL